MTPYFTDGTACQCGCGARVESGRRFVSGHNLRNLPRSEAHCRKIGEAQKRAWSTKRQRLPIGRKYIDSHGYTRVKVVVGAGRWALEHVLVAESLLGRKLSPGEVVHHIDGNRSNNDPANLYVCRDVKHHAEIHRTQDAALRKLLAAGLVVFKDGVYEAVL